ncbi:MAG: methylenetetrahydrofolate reductase, partial [Myxococcota bacterium]
FKAGIKMVGGCCGTGPAHITRVGSAARMVSPRLGTPPTVVGPEDTGRQALPVSERSHFGAMLGKKFVVSVEVNPGPGLDVERPIEVARRLIEAGADVINIADGPRATARMGNVALGARIQEALDIEVLLHVCTRDHNLIGLQAHVLGAHVLGIRNMVIITGDPPKVGDYPDATAVYDVDSIGLLRIITGFNRGVDPAGKRMDEQTELVLASGVEPGAQDFEREMVRFRQKVESGASVIMTQPIYEPETLERFLEASQEENVPIMVGILPLASYRNAEFIHNHIPGMSIPETIRERMRKAGKGAAARAEGVAIAVETLLAIRGRVAGAYIMPPLGRYEMAARVIEALGSDRGLAERVPGRVA